MTELYGKVLSVVTQNLGEPAVAAASIGATAVYVNDASTFDEYGGLVTINGEQLAYSTIDADADTITLSAALVTAVADQDFVEVYPPTPVKTAQVSLGGDGDPIPAIVPHALLDRLPEGTRADEQAETVTLEQRGTYDFIVADIIAEQLETQSLDYVEGEVGYGLAEAGVQVKDMQATGQIGATVVSADQIMFGGADLADALSPIPKSTKYATKGTVGLINAGTTAGTAELRLFTFTVGPVIGGRLYEVGARGIGNGTAGDVFWIRLRYTLDGSDPTTSSTTMRGGLDPVEVKGGSRARINSMTFFTPPTDGVLRVAISAQRLFGSGTFYIFTNGSDFEFQTWATDLGVDSDSATALQQTAKTDGSGSDNPPETTKTLTIQPTHVENWPGFSTDIGNAFYSDTGVADIGWVQDIVPTGSDRPGFAVLHFNHASIVSALSTASSIVSVQLRFKVKTRLSASGLDLSVFAHKYPSFPHSLAGNYASEVSATRIVTAQGSKNDAAPGAIYTITLNTAVGTNLKSGLYKGIGLTTTVYTAAGVGAIFANPSVDRPTLIITYKAPA